MEQLPVCSPTFTPTQTRVIGITAGTSNDYYVIPYLQTSQQSIYVGANDFLGLSVIDADCSSATITVYDTINNTSSSYINKRWTVNTINCTNLGQLSAPTFPIYMSNGIGVSCTSAATSYYIYFRKR